MDLNFFISLDAQNVDVIPSLLILLHFLTKFIGFDLVNQSLLRNALDAGLLRFIFEDIRNPNYLIGTDCSYLDFMGKNFFSLDSVIEWVLRPLVLNEHFRGDLEFTILYDINVI